MCRFYSLLLSKYENSKRTHYCPLYQGVSGLIDGGSFKLQLAIILKCITSSRFFNIYLQFMYFLMYIYSDLKIEGLGSSLSKYFK